MTSKNKKLFTFITDFVNRSEKMLAPYVVSGDLNREYIEGNQHRMIDPNTLTIRDKKVNQKTYRERKIFNKMLPIYLTRQGILGDNRPIIGFKPNHNQPESVGSSIVGNQFLKEFTKEINIGKQYEKILRHGDMYALVWIKTGIDWSKGDQTFEMELKSDKTEETFKRNFHEGRPFVDIVSIKDVFPDTLKGDSMEDINSLVHRVVMSVEKIEEKYGLKVAGEAVKKHDRDKQLNHGSELEYAYVYEYYEKPSGKHPQGRYVVACRDYIIKDGTLPYINKQNGNRAIPFDFYNLQAVADKIVGITTYNLLIDLQDTYNSIKNRLLEYINHIAIGQTYEYADSLVNPNQVTNKPGARILLKRHAKIPLPVKRDKVGNEISMYAKTIEEDMLMTAGLSQLSAFGMSKSNMRTDGVADKITESDNNKLTIALSNVADTMISVFKKVLYLEKHRHEILLKEFKLETKDDFMLKYSMKGIDPEELVVTNREFLMQSDIAIEKKTQQAANLGIYNPQSALTYRAKLELLDVMDSGYLKDTMDPVERSNFSLILREHNKVQNKKDISVKEIELHQMHIGEHTLYLLSPELASLEETDPKLHAYIVEAIQKHIDEHKQFVSKGEMSKVYQNAKAFK